MKQHSKNKTVKVSENLNNQNTLNRAGENVKENEQSKKYNTLNRAGENIKENENSKKYNTLNRAGENVKENENSKKYNTLNRAGDKIRFLTVTGVIGGLYAALTLALAPLSFGMVQCRVAEMLTILAAYTPAAIPGLTVGCAISNFVGLAMGANIAGALDIIVGTTATVLAAWLTYRLRHIRWGGLPVLSTLPPVVCNALIIGAELTLVSPEPTWQMWLTQLVLVGVGQIIASMGGGLLLAKTLEKSGVAARLEQNRFTNR